MLPPLAFLASFSVDVMPNVGGLAHVVEEGCPVPFFGGGFDDHCHPGADAVLVPVVDVARAGLGGAMPAPDPIVVGECFVAFAPFGVGDGFVDFPFYCIGPCLKDPGVVGAVVIDSFFQISASIAAILAAAKVVRLYCLPSC